jgi:hypothetical protein
MQTAQRNNASTQLGFAEPSTLAIGTGAESLVAKLARVPVAPGPLSGDQRGALAQRGSGLANRASASLRIGVLAVINVLLIC